MEKLSYVDLIVEAYLTRKKKNKAYSLRAFATRVGVSATSISLVLRRKRHLSPRSAAALARNLKWSKQKTAYFLSLLEYENPESQESKEMALSAILGMNSLEKRFRFGVSEGNRDMHEQSISGSEFLGIKIFLDPKKIPQVKEKISSFYSDMSALGGYNATSEQYHLSVRLLHLAQKIK